MKTKNSRVRPEDLALVVEAIEAPRASLEEVAEGAGTSRYNLVAYREGRARMPEDVRLTLAADLMARARKLEKLAQSLSESAGGGTEEDTPQRRR
jgi:hypothetical protein